MIDINLLRKQLPEVVARLKTRNFEFPEKEFLALENERKEIQSKTEELQAVRNSLSRQIGQAKKSGESAEDLMKEAAALPEKLADLEKQLGEIRNKLNNLLQRVPNLPNPECPIGRDDRANVEQWRWGTPRQFDFPVKDHVDVAAPLGMDFDTAAKLSGSRFCSSAPRPRAVHARSSHPEAWLHRMLYAVHRQCVDHVWNRSAAEVC